VGSADEVRSSIANGDIKFLQAAPGVGRRVAERVVVDLKDKVGLAATDDISAILKSGTSKQDEAAQALIALGYTTTDAAEALSQIDSSLSVEERVKQALKSK
jgi:Holliday junction DNA helicase RuvA